MEPIKNENKRFFYGSREANILHKILLCKGYITSFFFKFLVFFPCVLGRLFLFV